MTNLLAIGHQRGPFTGELDVVIGLVVGALAGAHCHRMCGPLVMAYGDRIGTAVDTQWLPLASKIHRQHLLFDLGRTTSIALGRIVCGIDVLSHPPIPDDDPSI